MPRPRVVQKLSAAQKWRTLDGWFASTASAHADQAMRLLSQGLPSAAETHRQAYRSSAACQPGTTAALPGARRHNDPESGLEACRT